MSTVSSFCASFRDGLGALALGQASMAVLALCALHATGVAPAPGWSQSGATVDRIAVSRRLPQQRRQELPLG